MQTAEQQQAAQREYYARTAEQYDSLHFQERDEHQFALAAMHGFVELFNIGSILDIGSGTCRALRQLKKRHPHVRTVGIEPSPDLRKIGHGHGLGADELIDGDAQNLPYPDGAFDLVCEFGTLHHVPRPDRAVREMLRVARVGIYISDSNKFGQGSAPVRVVKAAVGKLGLWPLLNKIRTRGKGYMISEGDGLFYSYSVFDNYDLIRRACRSVHLINTTDAGTNPKHSSAQVALLGLKADLLQRA